MAVVTQQHYLNIIPGIAVPNVIHCSQGDTGVNLTFTLMEGSELFDTTGATISAHGKRQDNVGWGPVTCTKSGSDISFTLPPAATAIAGSGIAEVTVAKSGQSVGTTNFAILVEEATFPLGYTYDNDASVYQDILNYVQSNSSNLEGLISSEISARTAGDNLLQAQIDEIIAPSGEAPSAAEVENARIGFDSRVYSTLRNAIVGQVNDIYSQFSFINEKIFNVNEIVIPGYVNDKYINDGGAVVNNTDYHYTNPIHLAAGQTILIKSRGYSTNVSVLSKTDSADSFHTPLVVSTDTDYLWYSFFIYDDGYYTICGHKDFNLIVLSANTPPDTIEPVSLKATEGKYINSSGSIGTSADYAFSDAIYFSKNERLLIKVRGYLTNIAFVSKTDSEGSAYEPLLISDDSDEHTYIFTVPESGYYAFSSRKSVFYVFKLCAVDLYLNNLNTALDIEFPNYTVTNDYYVNSHNGISSNNSFFFTKIFIEKGRRLNIITDGYNQNVSVISRCDQNNNVRDCLVMGDNMGVHLYCYDVQEAGYYLLSGKKSYYKIFTTLSIRKTIPSISLSLFERIGVIGDSYASGELYYGGHYHDKYSISWPQQIARRNGIVATNYSSGGLTAKSWLTAERGLSLLNNSPADCLYLLCLGLNDSNPSESQPLGQLSDITNYSNPDDYLDTFYGNYGRIIEAIKAHAPNAKIMFMTFIAPNSTREQWNNAIRELGAHYSISVATLQYNDFYLNPIYTEMEGGHPTAIGYSLMSIAYEDIICHTLCREYDRYQNYMMY